MSFKYSTYYVKKTNQKFDNSSTKLQKNNTNNGKENYIIFMDLLQLFAMFHNIK